MVHSFAGSPMKARKIIEFNFGHSAFHPKYKSGGRWSTPRDYHYVWSWGGPPGKRGKVRDLVFFRASRRVSERILGSMRMDDVYGPIRALSTWNRSHRPPHLVFFTAIR